MQTQIGIKIIHFRKIKVCVLRRLMWTSMTVWKGMDAIYQIMTHETVPTLAKGLREEYYLTCMLHIISYQPSLVQKWIPYLFKCKYFNDFCKVCQKYNICFVMVGPVYILLTVYLQWLKQYLGHSRHLTFTDSVKQISPNNESTKNRLFLPVLSSFH